jgi:hypothetical protein
MKPWIISVDLDGLLCKSCSSDKYPNAEPIVENINKVNVLYDLGHRIIIYTARGWYLYDITSEWLGRKQVKYNQLVMGKLYAHAYLDDLNYTLDEIVEKVSCKS